MKSTYEVLNNISNIPLKILRHRLTEYLKLCNPGLDSPEATVAMILMNAANIDKTRLLIGDYIPDEVCLNKIIDDINYAAKGVPVQYIIGKTEFMSLEFSIKPGVLIPRPDTELLVETCLNALNTITANSASYGSLADNTSVKVWDLCCGSGCVGLSIAHYSSCADVTLCDISPTALEVTKTNAMKLKLTDKTTISTFNVLSETMPYPADIVVSNPPYIETEEVSRLDGKVRLFEPILALDGGEDGLNFYRRIAKTANLRSDGYLIFEIGYNQGESVPDIMQSFGYKNIKLLKDMEGRSRVVIGQRI